eukprot:scaffold14562_cov133-Isochrysis_galbana.AAC.4
MLPDGKLTLDRAIQSKAELIESNASAAAPIEAEGDAVDDDFAEGDTGNGTDDVAENSGSDADAIKPEAEGSPTTEIASVLSRLASDIQDPQALEGLRETQTADQSLPILEPGTVVGKNERPKLIDAIKMFESNNLFTPANVSDRAAPRIEDDVIIKPSPMPDLVDEVKSIGAAQSTKAKFEAIHAASQQENAPLKPTWIKTSGQGNFRKSAKPRGGPPPKMSIKDLP